MKLPWYFGKWVEPVIMFGPPVLIVIFAGVALLAGWATVNP